MSVKCVKCGEEFDYDGVLCSSCTLNKSNKKDNSGIIEPKDSNEAGENKRELKESKYIEFDGEIELGNYSNTRDSRLIKEISADKSSEVNIENNLISTEKKPFYKKWWFFFCLLGVLTIIISLKSLHFICDKKLEEQTVLLLAYNEDVTEHAEKTSEMTDRVYSRDKPSASEIEQLTMQGIALCEYGLELIEEGIKIAEFYKKICLSTDKDETLDAAISASELATKNINDAIAACESCLEALETY